MEIEKLNFQKMKELNLPRGYVVHHDSRDIAIVCDLREEVWAWCEQQKIDLEGQLYGVGGCDFWRIKDEGQRVRFILRWL